MTHAKSLRLAALAVLCLLAAPPALADDDDHPSLDGVKVALETAVGTAATAGKGTPVAAGIEREDGKVLFEVLVVRTGEPSLYEVEIDAATGEVVEIEREDVEEEEEDEAQDEDGDDDESEDDEDDEDVDLAALVRALGSVKVSLADAVRTAAAHGKGKAVEAELERGEDGALVWDVDVLGTDGQLRDVIVDTAAGKVLAMRAESDEADDEEEDDDDEKDGGAAAITARLGEVKVTLAQAIATAEGAAKGRAVEAGYEVDDGKVVVEVTVLVAGPPVRLVEVEIDAATGAVLEVDTDDDEGEDDDHEDEDE